MYLRRGVSVRNGQCERRGDAMPGFLFLQRRVRRRGTVLNCWLLVPRCVFISNLQPVQRGILRHCSWRWVELHDRKLRRRVHRSSRVFLWRGIWRRGRSKLHAPLLLHGRHDAANLVRGGGILLSGRFRYTNNDRVPRWCVRDGSVSWDCLVVGMRGPLHVRAGVVLSRRELLSKRDGLPARQLMRRWECGCRHV